MNKADHKKIIKKHFKLHKKTIELFKEQIDEYNKLLAYDDIKKTKYNIADEVYIDNNTLIHGTRIEVEELEKISKNGLLAPEFLGKYNKNKKKPFVVEFWKIDEEISLKNYINKYCGVTIDVKFNNGEVMQHIITPIRDIEKEILSLKDYRDYIIYQNQEQRFLPNNYNNNSTMAFILKLDDINAKLLKNDIFEVNFDQKILKQIVPRWFYNKYMHTRNFDNYETGRERAVIYGVPSCLFEGILVSREIEKNKTEIEKIKKYFPNCYICNIDGDVIA